MNIKNIAYGVLAILLVAGTIKTVDWGYSCGRDVLCQTKRNLAADLEKQGQMRQPVHTAVSKIETICNREIITVIFDKKTVQKVVVNPTGLCAVVPKVNRGEIIFTGPDGPQEPIKPGDGEEEKRVRVTTAWALSDEASVDIQLCPPTKAKMTTWC